MSEIKEIKASTIEAIEATLPDDETVVRPTVIWGKPYVWITKRTGQFCLRPWPEDVTINV